MSTALTLIDDGALAAGIGTVLYTATVTTAARTVLTILLRKYRAREQTRTDHPRQIARPDLAARAGSTGGLQADEAMSRGCEAPSSCARRRLLAPDRGGQCARLRCTLIMGPIGCRPASTGRHSRRRTTIMAKIRTTPAESRRAWLADLAGLLVALAAVISSIAALLAAIHHA